MKKKSLMLFLLIILVYCGYAQVQHVAGVKSVDLTAGITRYGRQFSGAYVMYFTNKIYGKVQLFSMMGEQKESGLKYNSKGLDLYVAYNLLNVKEVLYVNAIGGFAVSSDEQTSGQEMLGLKIPSTIKYGVQGGTEIETFISRKFVFIVNFSQKFLMGNKGNFGTTRWVGQAGIRYNF